MRKTLFVSALPLTLLVGALWFAPSAYAAQTPHEYCSATAETPQEYYACLESRAGIQPESEQTPDPAAAKVTRTPDASPQLNDAMAKVMNFLMSLFAWLLGVAVLTLDTAVFYTVVKMGDYVNSLSAIGVTWRILRDIGNIVLIFGFLAAGIMTILNTELYGWGTKMLPKLLLAAVFLNFSLFAAEAIVDAGNLFATQFYTQINGGNPATPVNFDITAPSREGISNKIMSQLGLVQIYNQARTDSAVLQATNSVFIGFMSIIVFLIAAFVIFSLAFILIARFVVLIFLIILSPLGVAGLAIPNLAGLAKKWWHELIRQTFAAPVLLLLLYVALAVITDAQFLVGFGSGASPNWAGFIEGKNLTGFASIMLSFLVAMGLLLAVVIMTKSMSAFGAGWAMNLGGKLSFGVTGWAANRTVGRGSYYLGRFARQSPSFNKFDALTGRAISRGLDRAATGTFDLRGTKLLANLPGGGLKLGEPAKGGFAGARGRAIEDHEKAAKAIGEAYKEAPNTREEAQRIRDAEAAQRAAESEFESARKEYEAAKQAFAPQIAAQQAEIARLEQLKKQGPQSAQFDEDLQRRRDNLRSSESLLNEARSKQDAAFKRVKEVAAEQKEAYKAPETRRAEGTAASKRAYAEGIDHPFNPISWVAYGPDTGRAARKIRESLVEKSNKEKLAELAKKIAKEEEEEEKKAEEPTGEVKEPKESEPKPGTNEAH